MVRRWTVAEERFAVRFDGEAIHDARIDARELGMSLVGMADLLKAVQATQSELKDQEPVSLDVHATEEGSFIVDLVLVGVGSFWDYARNVLTGEDVTAVANLGALLGLTGGVLVWIKKFGIPKIDRHEQINEGTVRVWTRDGDVIEMPPDVFLAIRSDSVVKAAAEAVRPLEKEGIETLEIRGETTQSLEVVITKDDLPNFDPPEIVEEDDEDEGDAEDVWVTLLGVSLDGSGKYRVDDGAEEYQATLDDAEFLERVLSGAIQFGAADEVKVTVRHTKYRTRKQTRTRHSIERVQKLRRPGLSALVWDEDRDRKRI